METMQVTIRRKMTFIMIDSSEIRRQNKKTKNIYIRSLLCVGVVRSIDDDKVLLNGYLMRYFITDQQMLIICIQINKDTMIIFNDVNMMNRSVSSDRMTYAYR